MGMCFCSIILKFTAVKLSFWFYQFLWRCSFLFLPHPFLSPPSTSPVAEQLKAQFTSWDGKGRLHRRKRWRASTSGAQRNVDGGVWRGAVGGGTDGVRAWGWSRPRLVLFRSSSFSSVLRSIALFFPLLLLCDVRSSNAFGGLCFFGVSYLPLHANVPCYSFALSWNKLIFGCDSCEIVLHIWLVCAVAARSVRVASIIVGRGEGPTGHPGDL